MEAIMGSVTTIVEAAISWITSFVGVIVAQPLLLAFVLLSFVGLGVGLIARLLRL